MAAAAERVMMTRDSVRVRLLDEMEERLVDGGLCWPFGGAEAHLGREQLVAQLGILLQSRIQPQDELLVSSGAFGAQLATRLLSLAPEELCSRLGIAKGRLKQYRALSRGICRGRSGRERLGECRGSLTLRVLLNLFALSLAVLTPTR